MTLHLQSVIFSVRYGHLLSRVFSGDNPIVAKNGTTFWKKIRVGWFHRFHPIRGLYWHILKFWICKHKKRKFYIFSHIQSCSVCQTSCVVIVSEASDQREHNSENVRSCGSLKVIWGLLEIGDFNESNNTLMQNYSENCLIIKYIKIIGTPSHNTTFVIECHRNPISGQPIHHHADLKFVVGYSSAYV
jgi:hypothetical protein